MANLGTLIEQVRGVSYKPEDLHTTLNENSVTLLRANNIKDGKLNFDDVVYVDKRKVSEKQLLKSGDILICASSGSKELVGKAAFVAEDMPITFGAFCKVVRPKTECPQYIGHFFNSPYYRERIANAAAGANINNIRNEHIDVLEIAWPSLEEQQDAVVVLDKVVELIALRKEQLAKLDQLIKSRFIELFGDPINNPKEFPIRKLGSLSKKISDGVHAKPVYTETGRPFLSVVNINKGIVSFDGCKYVSEEAYQKMIKSTHPERGDVLYTKVGATYGIPAYVDTDIEFCLYVSVCLIKPKHDEINARFLALSMGMPYIKRQADSRIKGIGVPDLHLNQISEFDILCPPRDLQEQFIAFVEHTDKSKLAIQQSLDKLELLKKSLMQQYFG